MGDGDGLLLGSDQPKQASRAGFIANSCAFLAE
jgi:hypothetical protein